MYPVKTTGNCTYKSVPGGIIVEIYRITTSNVNSVAELMAAIKPDWWDFEGACQQLLDVSLLANLIGLYTL